ncbi:DedA family protein [Gulosibacter molinativorax]|uniref:DedA family protein n=1 Tax=Gulosibacter molinativorax TaxID=256821 RepID=A0ABT7CD30_9MICO|nr:DedA family protein [Gulosibacter molinativorax]MDJ1372567.1 DedA family protein [Gulosibacter molinativorax]QUY61508.1 Inner membrane protein YqjA [Gulosibacter molinativorax]
MHTILALAAQSTNNTSAFGAIGDWAISIMNFLGAPGVAFLVFLENLFPPIPSEVILPLAGFTAGSPDGQFTWVEALIWATAGSVIGAYALYGLGAWLGHARTVWLLGKLPLVDENDIKKTIAWFNKYGYWTVFLGRMIPIFRSLISIPAGIERMSWWRFGIFTFLGSAIWNTIFVYGGYALGSNWGVLEQAAGWLQYLVIAVVAALVIWYIVHKIVQARKSKRTEA